MLRTDGSILEASGQAAEPDARRALGVATQRIGRARSRDLDDDEAVEAWRALWAGRWSLVSRRERGGRMVLVARRNEPSVPEPKALSPRERQVLIYAQMGHSQKFISFELGISQGRVAEHLASGLRKLGLRDRTELLAFGGFGA